MGTSHPFGTRWTASSAVPEIGSNREWMLDANLQRLPPIVFLSMAPRPGLSIVAAGNRCGARLATQHLIRQGRRSVGFISGPPDWWEVHERRAGWIEALAEADLPHDDSRVIEGDWFAASRKACTLLERHGDPMPCSCQRSNGAGCCR